MRFRFAGGLDLATGALVLGGALLVAATLVAAVCLRGEPIKNSPKVLSAISESVQLARMVLRNIENN